MYVLCTKLVRKIFISLYVHLMTIYITSITYLSCGTTIKHVCLHPTIHTTYIQTTFHIIQHFKTYTYMYTCMYTRCTQPTPHAPARGHPQAANMYMHPGGHPPQRAYAICERQSARSNDHRWWLIPRS
jgi:hypothetical protein